MNTLTYDDNDDLVEILLPENIISPEYEKENNLNSSYGTNGINITNNLEASVKDYTLQEEYQNESELTECDIEDCNSALNFNKETISSLLDLKKHVTLALKKCERKLTAIETSLEKHTVEDRRILICNAGMPYFKDRNYFFAPNNEDEISKENRKELQVMNLPMICPWTIKDRHTLLKAVQEEAMGDVSCSQRKESADIDDTTIKLKPKIEDEMETNNRFPPAETLGMVGPLKKREFDWFKISSVHFEDIHSPLDCRVMWNVFLHPDINKNLWTKSEDAKLKRIAKKHKFQNWDKIARDLKTNRTAYQCFIRYNTTKKAPKVRNCTWNNEEDEKLLKLVEILKIGDFIPWADVADWLESRTKQQAYFRWTYSLAPYLTKGRFTETEDSVLRDAVIKFGTNFRKISAALLPNRSTIQLHDRYETLTAMQTENCNVWTLAEDSKLLDLFGCFGPNWSEIAKEFSCKSRTQLRHRHKALQRKLKKGISLFDIHKKRSQNENENKKEEEQIEGESYKDTSNSNIDTSDEDCERDIDEELMKYFYTKYRMTRMVDKHKLYTAEELKYNTRNLYSILQLLNAKLRIPDNVTDIKLNPRDQQLLHSLKEYTKVKNDKERYFEVINKCRLRMFGTNHNRKEGSHFIPPPPFKSPVKLRKLIESQCIDYNLNRNDNFLLEKPIKLDTPDFVISHIGGDEQELQFQKFSNSFQINNLRGKQLYDVQNIPMYSTKMSLQQSLNNSNDRSDSSSNMLKKMGSTVYSKNVEAKSFKSFSFDNCKHVKLQNEVITDKDVPIMEATYATLLSFRSLMHLKQSSRKCSSSNQCLAQKSYKFQEALKLLETRLEQLFKYPIGLSKTTLPEVYATDTMNNITSKRKASKIPKKLEKDKMKKLRTLDKNNKDLRW